jgi:hypothetical protein
MGRKVGVHPMAVHPDGDPRVPDLLGDVKEPRPRRAAQVQDCLTRSEEAVRLIDLLEFENRSGRIVLLLRPQGEVI